MFRSYYKLPVAQTNQENCVSHIPSLVPIPGRDIFVQAWYQGGASLVDFTDASNPKEIGYFDRGPINPTTMFLGGLWSTYYYNGAIYGSEIAPRLRRLEPHGDERHLAERARLRRQGGQDRARLNAQTQQPITWATPVNGGVNGSVPATLSLSIGPPAQFPAFTPGVGQTYETSTTANVISTAGDALLSVADPSSTTPATWSTARSSCRSRCRPGPATRPTRARRTTTSARRPTR